MILRTIVVYLCMAKENTNKKEKRIQVLLDAEDFAIVEAFASEKGLKLGTLIRSWVKEKTEVLKRNGRG